MKSRRFYPLFLSLILTLLASCAGLSVQPPTPTAPPVVILKASGSGTVTLTLQALAPDFEEAVPNYKLEVLPGKSTGSGVTGILEGLLDVAAMARPPKDEETAQNIKYYEFGLVGQALIVHPTVTGVESLNRQQVIDIFSGNIANWAEVGGPDMPIVLYVRDEDDSSTKGLRKAIFGETPFAENAKTIFSQDEMALSVEGTAGSIGIAGWPSILALQSKVNAVAIDGVRPDEPAYPILDSAGIGYLSQRESDIQPLLDWLSSAEGQAALRALGFVPSK
ncbi:MAG: substrate-binding domain-containing protein [Chloroflexi bacterium]|nr:substrate-binding domain-containing protein [Chloroflexota bacterium]MCA2001450.1 substrate-binding domain-containing protein [Chloroflexota bacterium]